MKKLQFRFLTSLIASALFLSGCGNVDESSDTPKSENPRSEVVQDVLIPKISDEAFNVAFSKVNYDVDEFDGSWEIFNNPKKEEVYRQATGPRDSRFVINIALYIMRKNSDSPLDARASIRFIGAECTNFYQWDTKSDAGVVNFYFTSELSSCESSGLPGVILEEANRYMSESDMTNYCNMLENKDVIFRVTGYDGILSQKGSIPASVLEAHKNICTIYQGLSQGLVPEKS